MLKGTRGCAAGTARLALMGNIAALIIGADADRRVAAINGRSPSAITSVLYRDHQRVGDEAGVVVLERSPVP